MSSTRTVLVVCAIGAVIAVATLLKLLPQTEPKVVERTRVEIVPQTEMATKKVTVTLPDGTKQVVEVPIERTRTVQVKKREKAKVESSFAEMATLYIMIVLAAVMILFYVATGTVWLYLVASKNRKPPTILNTVLKYMVTAYVGIFVGFMGGQHSGFKSGEATGNASATIVEGE